MRIWNIYGAEAVAVISENPYRLARDIRGIGFKTADQIAARLSLSQKLAGTGPQHLRQGIIDVFEPTKPHDTAMLIQGVSLSPERFWLAWTPGSIRRLSQAAVTQNSRIVYGALQQDKRNAIA